MHRTIILDAKCKNIAVIHSSYANNVHKGKLLIFSHGCFDHNVVPPYTECPKDKNCHFFVLHRYDTVAFPVHFFIMGAAKGAAETYTSGYRIPNYTLAFYDKTDLGAKTGYLYARIAAWMYSVDVLEPAPGLEGLSLKELMEALALCNADSYSDYYFGSCRSDVEDAPEMYPSTKHNPIINL